MSLKSYNILLCELINYSNIKYYQYYYKKKISVGSGCTI